jgi:hypothetical protein
MACIQQDYSLMTGLVRVLLQTETKREQRFLATVGAIKLALVHFLVLNTSSEKRLLMVLCELGLSAAVFVTGC